MKPLDSIDNHHGVQILRVVRQGNAILAAGSLCKPKDSLRADGVSAGKSTWKRVSMRATTVKVPFELVNDLLGRFTVCFLFSRFLLTEATRGARTPEAFEKKNSGTPSPGLPASGMKNWMRKINICALSARVFIPLRKLSVHLTFDGLTSRKD